MEVIPYVIIAVMTVKLWRTIMSLQELKDLSDAKVAAALAKVDDLTNQLAEAKAAAVDPALVDAIAANLNKLG